MLTERLHAVAHTVRAGMPDAMTEIRALLHTMEASSDPVDAAWCDVLRYLLTHR